MHQSTDLTASDGPTIIGNWFVLAVEEQQPCGIVPNFAKQDNLGPIIQGTITLIT
jgi:hypothetical protein